MMHRSLIARVVALVALMLATTGLGPATALAQGSGLVAAYTFNEGAGNTVADASGNGNTGTTQATTWTASGKYGGALVFNGSSSRVTIAESTSLQLMSGMTLEAWVYPTATPTWWRSVITKNTDRYYLMASSNVNRPAVGGTWAAGSQNTIAPAALAVNTWTHLAATFDGAMVRLYVNGVQVASQAQTTALSPGTGTLQIGANAYGENFRGRIDNVRIYNRALTAAEIQTNMATPVGSAPPADTAPPTVAISTPASGGTYATNASPLTVGGTAADNVGVTQVTWANDRGGSGTATGTTSWTAAGIALQSGTNVVTVTARDAAGYTATSTLTVSYDPTAPTVGITAPTSGGTYATNASPLTVGGTAADNVGVTQVTWANDRGGSGTATGTTSWTAGGIALQPGTNVVTVTARDAVGNAATSTLTVTYTAPDTAVPTVGITTPTSAATYTTNASPLTMGGTAADNVGVTQVTWANDRGGSGTATGTTSWTATGIALQAGANVVTVTARDAAGNVATGTLTVSYDPTAPTVAITSPTTEATYTASASPLTVGGTAADNVAVTQITWANDRGGSGTATGTTSWTAAGIALQTGANVLTVTARDSAGNAATKVLTVTYTAPDTAAPTVAISAPTSAATYLTNLTPLTVGGTAADSVGVTQVSWTNDRGGSGTASGTTSWTAAGIALQAGANALTVTARDAAGNTGTAVLTVSYDPTAPTVTLTAPAAGATVSGMVTVSANAADNIGVVGVQFLVDGTPLGAEDTSAPYGVTWDTTGAANGAHSLTARARDAAGNTLVSSAVAVTVSNAPQGAGLVAAYTFNEGTGGTVADASGNGNAGTIAGATWTAAGKNGGALVFNGIARVTIPEAASLQLTGGMTLEAWVYPTATPTWWRSVITKNTDRYYLMASSNTDRPAAGGTWASGNQNTTAPAALAVNTWTHLAATFDGAMVRLYVNGALVASQAQTTALAPGTGTLDIGANVYGEGFEGRIDDVRIYNRALTVTEILADLNTPVGGAPPADTAPPTVAISTPASGGTYATNASPLAVGGTAADNVGVTQVTWVNSRGGSGTATGTTSWTVGGIALQAGVNVVTVTARDAAGNTATSTLTVNYDPTAPTVAIASPTTDATYTTNTSPLTVGGTAADDIGVTQVTWSNDRGGSGAATGTASWTAAGIALQPGTNMVAVTARDAAGNTATSTLTVTYTAPDTTAPTVAINTPTSAATYATNATTLNVGGTAADGVGVTEVSWSNNRGGSGTASGTTSWTATGIALQPGINILTVTARDAAGNVGTGTLTVTRDSTAPTVALTAPAAGATVSGVVTVTANAGDYYGVVGVQFLVDGAPLGAEDTAAPYSISWDTSGVVNGPHTLSARARDAAGNTTLSAAISVTVSNATQPTGLVAAYAFNEGTGSSAADASGNGHTGTITGATWTAAGKNAGSLFFNGNAVVTIPEAASLQLTGGMTLEAWVYPTATPTWWRSIITKNTDRYYLMASSNVNRPAVGGMWGSGNQNTVAGSALVVNTWTHLAATFDGAMVRLYENGVLVASQAQTTALAPGTGTLEIGSNVYGEGFEGRIDDVRIYNRALTVGEIQVDLNTPVGGAPPADTAPPTVALNAPPAGATVSGLVSMSALASDDTAVVGVQFLVDGIPLGEEVPAPPYAVVWDTAGITGSHVLTAVARDISGKTSTSAPVSVTVAAPTPELTGQWAPLFAWPIVPVHASLLPTGEILSSDAQSVGADARLWNPGTGAFTAVPNPTTNIFCAGHCGLPDGRLFYIGGHAGAHVGLRDANIFDPATGAWSLVRSMTYPRWYPTATALPDGRVLVISGETNCDGCYVEIPEVYNAQTNTWVQLTGANLSLPYYPHMFVLPDGRVLAASTAEDIIVTRVLDVAARTWTVVDPNPVDGGSAVMYLPGKVMKSGTSADPDMGTRPSAATTYVLDMTQPTPHWQATAAMAFPRTYHTLTMLPDGTVLATGGGTSTDAIDADGAVAPAEVWSPVTQTWTTLASLRAPRLYHSIALLLPDARVLVAGGGRFFGGPDPSDQLTGEIFSPPYLFKGPRPVITSAPSAAAYGATISVQTPDAARIANVSLIKLGSVTHAFNADQRYLPLSFAVGGGGLDVQMPANANLAPPGYYMLFLLDTNGVPSVAAMVRVQ